MWVKTIFDRINEEEDFGDADDFFIQTAEKEIKKWDKLVMNDGKTVEWVSILPKM